MIWRGEVYRVDLGHPVGHEPAFSRPAVVVSNDVVNNGPGELVVVAPITSAVYGLRGHVEIAADASGLDRRSFARCDQIRVISTQRIHKRTGAVTAHEMRAIDLALRFILDL